MEKDAVSAGVSSVGGLFNTTEIRILICYILSSVNEPVPGRMLADMLHYEGIANCFEVNDSIAYLQKSGHLKSVDEAEDTYIITQSGRDIAGSLKPPYPFLLRIELTMPHLSWCHALKTPKKAILKFQRNRVKPLSPAPLLITDSLL